MTELKKIGPYEIVEQVGAGGMATVYKAYQPKLDRFVAIKLMHQAFAADATFLSRFEREARIVARLDHRAIVPVYDYDTHEGRPYLVMKYIEGRTLKEVMAERALSLDEIRGMMGRVADALTYAHEQGILHRDVKPSNIVIDNSGHAYLTDFGLARVALSGESTMSVDTMLGTPHYVSPEQAKGQADLDGRTDLYSLACVLYEQVTGSVPFSGDSAYAIIHKHLHAAPPLPSELNPELSPQIDVVFTRALSKDPTERYPTAAALMQAFEEAVQTTGLTQLDDARVSLAAARAPQVSEHTPGGGRYVSIPSPTGADAEPASWDEVLRQISGRVKSVVEDVRTEIEQRDIVHDIAEGVRGVAQEVQGAIGEGKDPEARERERRTKALKLIREDWGLSDESIRRRAQQRIEERRGLFFHAIIFTLVIVALFLTQGQVQASLGAALNNPESELVQAIGLDYLGPLATLNYALVAALMWGTGLISHGIKVFYNSGQRLINRRHDLKLALEARHGVDWPETIDHRAYKKVRKDVESRYNSRAEFFSHAVSGMLATAAVFIAWGPISEVLYEASVRAGDPWTIVTDATIPAIFGMVMAITILVHAMALLVGMVTGSHSKDRAIRREIERERELAGLGPSITKRKNDADLFHADDIDKAKRDPAIRLTEEGELTDSFVREIEDEDPRHQRH